MTAAFGPRAAASDEGPVVTTCGLTKDYGGTGLFDVDLVVPRGCVYGLVGMNGAGKTTLLSLLSGLRRPDRGTVTMAVDRIRVAVCPDVPEFDGWLTAYEAVDLARSLVAPVVGREAVAIALGTAGLADAADRRIGGFSRGMVQRVGLACALVGEPEVLILDEPTSALDPAGRAEILSLLAAMRGNRTVIVSSHILADVQRIADQVGILRDGRLLYQGATQTLIDTYLTPTWLLRIAGDMAPVIAAMASQHWVISVESAGSDTIRVDATSIEAGERGIPGVIARCDARQVSCEPAAADLESAFLALTGAGAGGADAMSRAQQAESSAGTARQPLGEAGIAAGLMNQDAAVSRPMSLWRLEWLRLTRTPRAIALAAVFVFYGLVEPIATKYENKLLAHVGNGVRIYLPPPTPAAGLRSYIGESSLIGLIVVVVLAAGAFAFDSRPGVATFLRTRVGNLWQIVAPRFAFYAGAASGAYLLGTIAAWYETRVLIGSLPVAGMLAGVLCGALYLTFAVAVTAAAASVVRGTLAAVGMTLAVLVALPVAGTWQALDKWLPSTLVNAPVDLVSGAHHLTHFASALAVTCAATVALLAVAVSRLSAREI